MIPIIATPVRLRPTVTRWTRPSGEITWESRAGAPADRAQASEAVTSRDIHDMSAISDALIPTIATLSIEARPSRSMFVFPAAAPGVYGGIDNRFEYLCPKPLADLEAIAIIIPSPSQLFRPLLYCIIRLVELLSCFLISNTYLIPYYFSLFATAERRTWATVAGAGFTAPDATKQSQWYSRSPFELIIRSITAT